jgi:hypothetical protein
VSTQKVRNFLFACSLILNVALGAGLYWLGTQARNTMMNFTADCAEEQAKLQEKVVAELDKLFPDQTNKTHDLKQELLVNIDAQKRVSYRVRTGAIGGM